MENLNKLVLEWISESIKIPSNHLQFSKMKGATSSALFLIQNKDTMHPHPSERFVLRVLNNSKWLSEEPDLAFHEASVLKEIEKANFHAPKLINYSEEKQLGSPLVLMSFLEGDINITPLNFQKWLAGLAKELAMIHQHKVQGFPWHFKSWVKRDKLKVPDWTAIPEVWEKLIEIFLNKKPDFKNPVFIHRDYHPMNVLWTGDSITGVVDWINACLGPAEVDVAHCKTNLALMYGPKIANDFLNAYLDVSPQFKHDPYWDLDSVFDMCFPEPPFYHPWSEFGINEISSSILRERIDTYINTLMENMEY